MNYEKELLPQRTNDKSGETRMKDRKEDEGPLCEFQPVWQLWVLIGRCSVGQWNHRELDMG